MKKSKTKIILFSILALAVIVAAIMLFMPKQHANDVTGNIVVNPQPAAQKTDKITIAYFPLDASLSFFVAKEQGYFAENGLEVNAVEYKSSKDAMDAFLQGKVDVIFSQGTSALIATEAKSPGEFRLFHIGSQTDKEFVNYLLVPKNSSIKSITDLKNKRVGAYKSTTSQVILQLIAKKLFNDANAYQITLIAPDLQGEALALGEIDALYTTEPYATILQEKIGARILVENPLNKYILSPWPSGGAIVSTKYANNNPDAVRKLIKVSDQAVEYIRNNPEAAKRLLSKYTPIDENTAIETNTYRWYKSDETADHESFKENVQKLADIMYDNKLIDNKVDMSNIYYINK